MTNKTIRVSQQTQKLLGCMQTMHDLYSQVYDALKEIYTPKDVERIVADGFIAEYEALEQRIEQFVIGSIKERMMCVDSGEI